MYLLSLSCPVFLLSRKWTERESEKGNYLISFVNFGKQTQPVIPCTYHVRKPNPIPPWTHMRICRSDAFEIDQCIRQASLTMFFKKLEATWMSSLRRLWYTRAIPIWVSSCRFCAGLWVTRKKVCASGSWLFKMARATICWKPNVFLKNV